MIDNELAFTPATELIELISSKKVSPVELTSSTSSASIASTRS